MCPMQASRKAALHTLRRCLLEGLEDDCDTLVIADDNMYYRCGLSSPSQADD